MVYRLLADAVVVTHFAFIAFVVVGPYLARRRRPLVWLHLPALAWAIGIVAVGYECPLTALENHFRRLAGERIYPGGFVDHYIENVIYPQRFTPLVLTLGAVLIAAGYAGLVKTATAAGSRRHRIPHMSRTERVLRRWVGGSGGARG